MASCLAYLRPGFTTTASSFSAQITRTGARVRFRGLRPFRRSLGALTSSSFACPSLSSSQAEPNPRPPTKQPLVRSSSPLVPVSTFCPLHQRASKPASLTAYFGLVLQGTTVLSYAIFVIIIIIYSIVNISIVISIRLAACFHFWSVLGRYRGGRKARNTEFRYGGKGGKE